MPAPRFILGISCFYHDSAAALVDSSGRILAAAQEERFTRIKGDARFPQLAIAACLKQAAIDSSEVDTVVFHDKPIRKFGRMIETFAAVAPAGMAAFARTMPSWLDEKLDLRRTARRELPDLRKDVELRFTSHHLAHAASAFLPSPFRESAILTVDGVGEWATTTLGFGKDRSIQLLRELRFPHSLGLLYSTFTGYCGFRVNSGEYKLMGLAPYGTPRFANRILEHLVDLKPDGSLQLHLDNFDFLTRNDRMTNEHFHRLFEGPPRAESDPIDPRHLDVAASIQAVTTEAMLRMAREAKRLTGSRHLCLAGGVALNCVANGAIHREGIFDRIWIQPAAGDAGGALGAALAVAANSSSPFDRPTPATGRDAMSGALLGPEYSADEIQEVLQRHRARFEKLSGDALYSRVATLLAEEQVVGWFQGRMEFGPRALGNRSILGDARSSRMQSVMNLKVKFRESFRPFAPIVRASRVTDYFDFQGESPYMLIVAPVLESLRRPPPAGTPEGLGRRQHPHSTIPAVTHVDYSARLQTVSDTDNPRLAALLNAFEALTGCPVLINTSFNVRGEPVVCSPEDALICFVNTEMDWLVLGDFLLRRTDQPSIQRRVSVGND